jgi:carbon storage regulator
MLILTRKPGESIFVLVNGEQVKVTVVELKGNQIRLGIDAPPSIRIYREEIWEQILEENRRAAEAAASAPSGEVELPDLPGGWKPAGTAGVARAPASSLIRGVTPEVVVRKKRGKRDDE